MVEENKSTTQEQGNMVPADNGGAVAVPVKKDNFIVAGAKKFGGMVVSGTKKLYGLAKEHPLVATGTAFGVGVGATMLVNHFFGGDAEVEDIVDVEAVDVDIEPEVPEIEVPEVPEIPEVGDIVEDMPEIPEVPSVEGIFED